MQTSLSRKRKAQMQLSPHIASVHISSKDRRVTKTMAQLINKRRKISRRYQSRAGWSMCEFAREIDGMELVACRHASLSSSIYRKATMHPTHRGTRGDVGRRFLEPALNKLLGFSVQGFSSRVIRGSPTVQLNEKLPPGDLHADRTRIGLIQQFSQLPPKIRAFSRAKSTCRVSKDSM
uniref:Uncharacterized protein n=1 Tax=Oryza brachyantha TaxID=4533 RepID=J3LZW3_ORYBR